MKYLSLIAFLLFSGLTNSFAQTLITKDAYISFYSDIGGISAENSKGYSTLNQTTGDLFFKLHIENFIFKNSLMQKHYNEPDMMNSEKYPTATFKGKVTNNDRVNYAKDGTYNVSVSGKLSIKGVSKSITTKGMIKVKAGKVVATSVFSIDRHDYNVVGNEESVSQVMKLTVRASY